MKLLPFRIFISHSSKDKEAVDKVRALAVNAGVEVYVAEYDPRPGIPIANKVRRNIEVSNAVVVLLTKNAEVSHYVQQEIGAARQARKLVIALVARGVDTSAMGMMEGLERIDFDPEAPEPGLATLHRVLQREVKSQQVQDLVVAGLLIGALIILSRGDPPTDLPFA